MSTWQIFSDAGDNFRWEICSPELKTKPSVDEPPRIRGCDSRLPSMRDLLLKESPKLQKNGSSGIGSSPMFQTGSGKLLAAKQSSIAKARSVLGDVESAAAGYPKRIENGTGGVDLYPMFQTASGNSVPLEESSIAKARLMLGDEIFEDDGCPRSPENDYPMFQTGSGKSVAFKQSSIAKARLVLGEDDGSSDSGCLEVLEDDRGGKGRFPMLQSGSGKSLALKQSSIARARSVLGLDGSDCTVGRENGCRASTSLFQTGSGKLVSVSSAGLVKAKTLLGLDESDSPHYFQGVERKNQLNDNELNGWKNIARLKSSSNRIDAELIRSPLVDSSTVVTEKGSDKEAASNIVHLEACTSAVKTTPIKFNTAGGRAISISSDALRRARSLLGQAELDSCLDEGNGDDPVFSNFRSGNFDRPSLDEKNNLYASTFPPKTSKSKSFVSPFRSLPNPLQKMNRGDNLIEKFDAVEHKTAKKSACMIPRPSQSQTQLENSLGCGSTKNTQLRRSSVGPLIDITNTISTDYTDKRQIIMEKRRLGKQTSGSPFKRPRNSKFTTPLNGSNVSISYGHSSIPIEDSCCQKRVSTRYPFEAPRVYIKDYFGGPPSHWDMLESLSDKVRWMNPDIAENYILHREACLEGMGVEAFHRILVQSGASPRYASRGWVANHFKWIVWKLACYDRCYPAKSTGLYLTVSNVLEELKYRYEREFNHGHRSAIKRILEGDAPPSSMMVLCVSAIHSSSNLDTEALPQAEAKTSDAEKVEMTDGWYSIDAFMDSVLSKKLKSGKLHIGQKLRIWGAGLCGWVGPVSPLEMPRAASLLLHVNGTYRAHWADRLGLCNRVGAPLALRCIKSGGGPVPLTLLGVKRIYPVLFKERLKDGKYIVRSDRMETKMMQLHNQRRSNVVEGIISEFERSSKYSCTYNDSDSEEGAQILKLLETAAEPEVLMAAMSSKQLNSFATYRAKLEANRQSEMQKSIEKALDDAGLSLREVTPFMRVRVVGLTSRSLKGIDCSREGLITIWNPTDKQKFDLDEGKAYVVPGLVPLSSDSHTLYLQARGPTTRWQRLSPSAVEDFKPFFSPRQSVFLSNLGEVPLSSEFDIAAVVVYVGEVHTAVQQKQQWVFVTDGSVPELQSENLSSSLLAISFCLPCTDDSTAPINNNLAGSIVCFCNLIKRAKDQANHLWVAEAAENSTYFLSPYPSYCCHLKDAARSAERWAKASSLIIEKLREKVLFIIGNCEG